ncbi:MAG: hypothetical protein ACK4VX_07090 [Polaromonas sp.]
MDKPVPDKIDVALSGGGIRSATFALGVLQTLAQHGLLEKIRTLSTVSGGGYIGSFLCRLAAQVQALSPGASAGEAWKKTGDILLAPTTRDVLVASPGSPVFHPLQWLRENSRYLTPSGSDDLVSGLAYYLRGLLALHFNLAVLLILCGIVNIGMGVAGDAFMKSQETTLRQAVAQVLAPATGPCSAPAAPEAVCLRECVAACPGACPATATPAGCAAACLSCAGKCPGQASPAACAWTWIPSGWWAMAALAFALALATGVAYWLTSRRTRARGDTSAVGREELVERRMGKLAALVLLATFAGWAVVSLGGARQQLYVALVLAAVCLVALAIDLLAYYWKPPQTTPQRSELAHDQLRTDVQRRRLTWLLAWALKILAFAAVLAAVDTLAMSLVQYHARHASWLPWTLPVAVYGTLLAAAWKWMSQAEPVDGKASRLAGLMQVALLLLALAVLFVLVLVYQIAAYKLVFARSNLADISLLAEFQPELLPGALIATGLAFVVICIQYTPGFLNLSSFHNLYTARLKRAYLGAANPQRLTDLSRGAAVGAGEREKAFVNEVVPGDEPATIDRYLDDNRKLGIEHVVNVTLNQRLSATSPTLAQDRQGLPVCLTAQGMLVNPPQSGHASPGFDLNAMQQSPLSLGQWISISGAAFSVGVGKETKPGYALLAFLANVRTAYWWRRPDTDTEPKDGYARRLLKGTWCYLWEEARCRFRGIPGRYWYLSDGGHFDNTGVYELVRRKLPLVLASDNGADPCYQFDDLMHLVRRVRVDFGAEAVIRSAGEIGGLTGFGTPEAFREAQKAGEAMPYAVWLELYYDREQGRPRDTANEPPDSVVIFIKPALSEGLPGDVGHYARTHPSFPQETTADQFFDEAQWESYRALGQVLSARLLAQDVFGAVAARLAPRQGRLL